MKRIITLCVALLTALALVSGAALAQSDPIITTFDIAATADYQLANAQSYEIDVSAVLDMEAEGEHVSMNIGADVKYIKDPLKMKLDLSLDIAVPDMNEKADGEVYLRSEDGTIAMYLAAEGEAMRMELPGELFGMIEALNAQSQGTGGKSQYEYISLVDTQKLNGRDVYVLSAAPTLTMDDFSKQLINEIGFFDMVPGMTVENMLKDMRMTLYIDAKTYQYARVEMDMGPLLNKLYADMGLSAKVNSYLIRADYKNIGKVKSFDVPKSLVKKAAQNDIGNLLGQ